MIRLDTIERVGQLEARFRVHLLVHGGMGIPKRVVSLR